MVRQPPRESPTMLHGRASHAIQQAMIDHAQTMTDHMLAMAGHMAMMPPSMDMQKKNGMPMKKGTADDQTK